MAKLAYYNTTYKGLSYSRQLMLHTCPRKFEITAKTEADVFEDCITFAYGSSIGAGIQSILLGNDLTKVVFDTVVAYDYDIFAECTAREIDSKKSVFWAVDGVKKLHLLLNSPNSPLAGWEVAYFVNQHGQTIPASELSFVLECGEGFTYEGHIDLVIRNKVTGVYAIVEIKTDGTYTNNPLKYENSNQALGYSMILEQIADAPVAYQVFYFVYETRKQEYQVYTFNKQMKHRARWLLGLESDIQFIKTCESGLGYQMRGQSCFNYNRPCKLAGRCDMSNETLSLDKAAKAYAATLIPDFTFKLEDLFNFGDNLINIGRS